MEGEERREVEAGSRKINKVVQHAILRVWFKLNTIISFVLQGFQNYLPHCIITHTRQIRQ